MQYSSIDIQGSILSGEILSKIRSEQMPFQNGRDFNTEFNNSQLKDEIGLAWQEAKGQWTIFQSKLQRLSENETAATETRNFWMSPLLSNLGYDFSYIKGSEELNGKSFWINNRDSSLEGFPLILIGYNESLDKRPENKQYRVSPHALMQEYLNYSEHLYGLVTNGKQLRLLRDASRITRLSYIEFNLEKMMEEDLYSDFVILYRLLHASRMPRKRDAGPESIIEEYHQDSLEAGATIRNKLGDAVKGAIKELANGFVNHSHNQPLKDALDTGDVPVHEFYHHLLRIIYRLLFLFVIEERNLVYGESKNPETKRYNNIYFKYYSLMRLRKLAKNLPSPDSSRYHDLWLSLLSTFTLFENSDYGKKLGIMSLKGDLFGYFALSNSYYDMHSLYIDNATLLSVIRSLAYFENENKVLIAVNYGGLDVEEFGSVYEGLLELNLEVQKIEGSNRYNCAFTKKEGGREFQSHYTPEELVQPLIKHSLEYLIEDRVQAYRSKQASKEDTAKALLSLKICDVACGSGHILLSAARRVALELARVQTDEEQPNPHSIRKALKEVIKNCIYGVDKNPLAIELCKIALWLESHNPGEPLSFLDHHIKCGDAIVGLAHKEELLEPIPEEAFKKLPGDDSEVLKTLSKRNKDEIAKNYTGSEQISIENQASINQPLSKLLNGFKEVSEMPERSSEEMEAKQNAYNKLVGGNNWLVLKNLAHARIAQFFIPKITENREKIMTTGKYFNLLRIGRIEGQDAAYALGEGERRKFFHWFIEFPEVMSNGGFDCILGNPPYLGGSKISGEIGDAYLRFIKFSYSSTGGRCDLAAYFLRRIFDVLNNKNSYFSIITTNSICQNETRVGGLDQVLKSGGTICFAVKSTPWPGVANLSVSLCAISKNENRHKRILGHREVKHISSLFEETLEKEESLPVKLQINNNKVFEGSKIYGDGFIISEDIVKDLFNNASMYREIIYPYINGEDINSEVPPKPTRWVINFFDWTLDQAKRYIKAFEIIKEKVKPYRDTVKRERTKQFWWQYEEKRTELYRLIKKSDLFFIASKTSKYINLIEASKNWVYSSSLVVFLIDDYANFSIIQSNIHSCWVYKYASTLDTRLVYGSSNVFETFAFPQNLTENCKAALSKSGEGYHHYRLDLINKFQLGLTKINNLFHSRFLATNSLDTSDNEIEIFEKYLVTLRNDLSLSRAIDEINGLRKLQIEMDNAVLDAYGWTDIDLKHDFYEADYLPENDRVRFTIHPDARKEILKRLLELNHKIHQEEVEAGLWDKKKTSKLKKSKEQVEGVSQQAFDLAV